MQKFVILISCLVCLAAAGSLGVERKPWWLQNIVGHEREVTSKWEITEQDIRVRQKFLLDVLLQVQKPVVNKELIELGKVLITEPTAYTETQDELLLEFLQQCREHEVLGHNEIYSETNIEHIRQLVGLTKFLTFAKGWTTFQRNVCFARLHLNPIMFVNALLMAVHEREDTQELIMPAMHEILPQLFYDKDVILTAENVEWLDLVTKTTTTKPSLMNIIGLGNMLNMMSPIHWIRLGKTGIWRPWHDTRRMQVDVKAPIRETMIVGQIGGGPIVRPIDTTWRTQLDTPVVENKIDDTKIQVQSDEKLIINVEQQDPLAYLTDDVGLNTFWNHAMNQRLVETVTSDKHHTTRRLGVEKIMPWEKQWKNQGKWGSIQARDEERRETEWQPHEWTNQDVNKPGKWEHVVGLNEERRHTEWQPEIIDAEEQQWLNEKLMAGERIVKRVGQKWRTPVENIDNSRLLHVNRRHQKSKLWQTRQNVPEMSVTTKQRWNTQVPEIDDDVEERQHIRGRWNNIRNGRVVVEEVKPWTTDRLDRQHVDDWMSGEMKPNRGNWLKPESTNDWSLWQQRNRGITEKMTKPRGGIRVPWFETDNDNVWGEHVARRGDNDDADWLNKRNGWVADIENKQWQSRDQPWSHDEVNEKPWLQREPRKINDDDWTSVTAGVGKDWQKSWQDRRIIDDDWVNTQRRPIVGDRDEVEIHTMWEDRSPNDGNRWVYKTTNDDDWVTPQHVRHVRSIKTTGITPAQQLMNERVGEIFIQNIKQLMARINLEKIALTQTIDQTKTVDEQIWRKTQLITTTGKLYELLKVSPVQAITKIDQTILKLKNIIDNELEHVQIRPNNPEIVKIIGEILVQVNGKLGNVWDELYNDINKEVYGIESFTNQATLLSIPTANLREPIYQDILTSLNQLIWRYKQQLQPYKREQLLVPGIRVDHVEVDDLVTYFDVTDGDLINLVDQQLLQSNINVIQKLEKQLVARQQRLNHKQFTLGYDITAEQPQRVVVRTFLGPKVDEHGRTMPLEVARQHYILLDAFVQNLIPGGNHIERNSRDIVWTTRDTSSLSEIYRRVMQDMPMHELISSNCRYPHRLLLPRGTPSGLPMQLLIVVTPVLEEDRVLQERVEPELLCGLGIAAMHLDTLPLDFPLDRSIENVVDFIQPNMLLKDVVIKHDERVEVPRV